MTQMGLSISDRNTINNIANKERGEWLFYNKRDEIVRIKRFNGKCWYVVSDVVNFYFCNQHFKNIKRIIKTTTVRLNNYLESSLKTLREIKAMEVTMDRYLDRLDKFNRFYRSKKIAFAIDETRRVFNQSVLSYLNEKENERLQGEDTDLLPFKKLCKLIYKMIMRTSESIEENPQTLSFSKSFIEKYMGKDFEKLKGKYFYLETVSKLAEVFDRSNIAEARRGLELYKAKACSEGKDSAFFIFSRKGEKIGVFKPLEENDLIQEEKTINGSFSMDNKDCSLRTDHVREKATFIISSGLLKVPKIQMARLKLRDKFHPDRSEKVLGSYQEYIPDTTRLDKTFLKRRAFIPFFEAHYMAILDIRLLNTDRRLKNILIDKKNHIYPINHKRVLPRDARKLSFEWLRLPQISWHMSRETKKYISSIDSKEDAEILKKMGVEREAVERMEISTRLLQKAAEADFSLFDIAKLMINGTGNIGPNPNFDWKEESFFEHVICFSIFKKGFETETFLDDLIQKYQKNNEFGEERTLSLEESNVEEIAEGISLQRFSGQAFGKEQKIHAIKIDDFLKNPKYRVRIIDVRDYSENPSDPKMILSETFKRLPNALAMINGGYFHFYHDRGPSFYYKWDLPYKEGDPCGALKANGRIIEVNPQDLGGSWGIFSSSIDGKVSIAKNDLNLKAKFEALGCSPILIKKGKITNLQKKASKIFNKSQALLRPGNFADHIFARHSRSAVCITKDGSLLFVSASGDKEGYLGMTGEEFAYFLSHRSAIDALNLDGGGSVSMAVRKENESEIKIILPEKIKERPITSALAIEKI